MYREHGDEIWNKPLPVDIEYAWLFRDFNFNKPDQIALFTGSASPEYSWIGNPEYTTVTWKPDGTVTMDPNFWSPDGAEDYPPNWTLPEPKGKHHRPEYEPTVKTYQWSTIWATLLGGVATALAIGFGYWWGHYATPPGKILVPPTVVTITAEPNE